MARLHASVVTCLLLGLLVPHATLAQAPGPGRSATLPAGDSRDLVQGVCTNCHTPREILRSSGYSAANWKALIASMIDLSGTPDTQEKIVSYLATHFPEGRNPRPAKLMPGTAKISFKEWVTPTLGQRSRDPVEAADGTIWWAGQWANLIGRINPATGEMKEYQLPAKAMPHTVVLDAEGSVWYTGNKNGSVGKLDPKTGKITVFKMPDPKARDPHTAVFDANGIMWFTLQQSNMIGRLDPGSGDIKLVTSPRAGSKPYGIKIDAAGVPWVACNGANCLIKVDPKTMQLTEVKLPIPATTVRRLDIAPDGMIWYVNSSQGRLGRYDPKTGQIKEWASPSGAKSHPYAIVITGGYVWYNESGVRPDPLVRFDPRTETFQSWPIPSGSFHAGIIRHMRANKDGNILIHQSSTNRIILVDINGNGSAATR